MRLKIFGLAYSYSYCTVFSLLYFDFDGKSTSAGGLYLDWRFIGGIFALRVWGAYIGKSLYMEGIIFGISRYLWTHTNQCLSSKVFIFSLRKQPTFRSPTTDFLAKWRLGNERRNFILMFRHYPNQPGSASNWLEVCFNQSEAAYPSK